MIIVKYIFLQVVCWHGGCDEPRSFHYSRTFHEILMTEGENRMIRIKNRKIRENEGAVSPVVGVMLMLIITIIIAAVVSGFAGGLINGGSNQNTPSLSMTVNIANTGTAATSGFSATVNSISQPTPTNTLKILTTWMTTMKDNSTYSSGSTQRLTPTGISFVGGNTTMVTATGTSLSPYGFGPGVTGITSLTPPYYPNQYFGNFTLKQGTGLIAEPLSTYGTGGAAPYYYNGGGSDTGSALGTFLGNGWEQLRTGDIVTVRVIYAPTGKIMFQKDVAVTGA